ncbi:unnamed protein product [Brachionus calyciflorus]|uniref:Trimeric intracellular cation channel type B n=1 Tax=Brachionus calyciflorus TaxID=104777 RepID=A0A813TGJ7_9BILA|nr:unnamed protein product [Brachionus calyciflorus]
MKFDQATLEEYGSFLLKLKMYPYFDIAHYILMCLAVREDIQTYQSTIPNFHKRHPLACYLSSMLLCFGGGMLVHFLLGEPILDDFKTHQGLVLATACWYLVFFSPFDLVYKLVKFLPIKLGLSVLKEIQRSRKIFDGVNHGLHLYPNSYIIIVLVGALKGAGSGFLTIIDRFNRGIYLPNTNETLHPSFATKGCLVAAILFTAEKKLLLNVPRPVLFFVVAIVFAYIKVMSIFIKSFDPFVPFENLTAAVFFGGIMDALRQANKSSAGSKNKSDTPSADLETKKLN